DVTERKRIDDELRRANKDLEQFAFSASHDLQEPLRAIQIYSQLLTTRYAQMFEGEPSVFLGYLRQGATRMEALLRDLLSYTRVTRLDKPNAAEDVAAAVSDTLELLSVSVTECGARVTSGPLPALCVHGAHLRLLFQNLVGNAIKYRS